MSNTGARWGTTWAPLFWGSGATNRLSKGCPGPTISHRLLNRRKATASSSVHSNLLSDEERRAKADFWDVWSRLFADRYFKTQADWCEAHGVSHITHLDKDDELPWCVKMEGDPFRCLSRVQVPGIDVIWTQIWYGSQTEFPRLASSTAHVYGRQRAFSESFAAYRRQLDIPSVKYIVDYQMARGINFFEFMFWMSKKEPSSYMAEPGMEGLNAYVNRAAYMMSQGRPSAQTAIYVPMPTLWLGNNRADAFMKAAAHLLTSHQYDFDFITDDGLVEATEAVNGTLRNKSGQAYSSLIIPSSEMVSAAAWQRITDFAARGGKVVFIGDKPTAIYAKSMMQPRPITPINGALHLTDSLWHPEITAFLPRQELTVVSGHADSIAYCARKTDRGMIFFILNQQAAGQTLTLDLDCMGEAQLWDAMTGTIRPLSSSVVDNKTRLSLPLEAWGSAIVVVTKRTAEYNVRKYKSIQAAIDQAHADGGGTVVIPPGKHRTGALFFTRGVDLRLEKGSRLISITDTTLYPIVDTRWEGTMLKGRAALLNFCHNDGCRISGEGLIDAQGLKWKKKKIGFTDRPRTICLDHCDGGQICGVSILNQAFWCLHILFTNHFTVDGISICAEDYIPSSDGIDIDSSTDITVRNTHIKAHDDCISIKSGRDTDGRRVNQASQDILIEHCHFDYGHGGVAIGSEVSGGVRNVTVRHCDMAGENWNPIRFKSQPSRGGVVENIHIENVNMINIPTDCILFDLHYTGLSAADALKQKQEMAAKGIVPERDMQPVSEETPQFKDIYINNVTCQGAMRAFYFNGLPEMPVTNINISNTQVTADYGIEINESKDITIDHVQLFLPQGREPFTSEYVENVKVSDLRVNGELKTIE